MAKMNIREPKERLDTCKLSLKWLFSIKNYTYDPTSKFQELETGCDYSKH